MRTLDDRAAIGAAAGALTYLTTHSLPEALLAVGAAAGSAFWSA
jgi:hypothetical protein